MKRGSIQTYLYRQEDGQAEGIRRLVAQMVSQGADQLADAQLLASLARHTITWIREQVQTHGQPWPVILSAWMDLRQYLDALPADVRQELVDEILQSPAPAVEWITAITAPESADPRDVYEEARLCALKAKTPKATVEVGGAEYVARFRQEDKLLRSQCGDAIARYIVRLRLGPEHFIALMDRLSLGVTADNPESYTRAVILREEARARKRAARLARRCHPEECDSLYDPENIESSVTARVDWEHGRSVVSDEQQRFIEAEIAGISLGWDLEYLDSVRRLLEPDMPAGKRLRKRFQAYKPKEKSKFVENKGKKLSGK